MMKLEIVASFFDYFCLSLFRDTFVCIKCWKLIAIAMEIVDKILRGK